MWPSEDDHGQSYWLTSAGAVALAQKQKILLEPSTVFIILEKYWFNMSNKEKRPCHESSWFIDSGTTKSTSHKANYFKHQSPLQSHETEFLFVQQLFQPEAEKIEDFAERKKPDRQLCNEIIALLHIFRAADLMRFYDADSFHSHTFSWCDEGIGRERTDRLLKRMLCNCARWWWAALAKDMQSEISMWKMILPIRHWLSIRDEIFRINSIELLITSHCASTWMLISADLFLPLFTDAINAQILISQPFKNANKSENNWWEKSEFCGLLWESKVDFISSRYLARLSIFKVGAATMIRQHFRPKSIKR